ncbi:MAG: NosD domain-containing protein [Candidatus Thermoplasmatota archaeon]
MKKTTFPSTVIAILLFTSLIILLPNPSAQNPPGEIITVNQNGNGDYTTIKSAIEDASNGDTIQIQNGVYKEHNIIIDKKIKITGENVDETIINCQGGKGLLINSCCVEVDSIKIINTDNYAIQVSKDSGKCVFSNIILSNCKTLGLWIRSSDNTFSNCEITGKGDSVGAKIRGTNNRILNSEVHGFNNGILILVNSDNHKVKNCKIFDNEKGIDIRINSDKNVISHCDISYNTYGVYIWQNSENNLIYRNNLWKNTENAYSEGGNQWDNGQYGNYWDDYTGSDNNSDDIGDTPYVIHKRYKDNYPRMSFYLPTQVTPPYNIRVTSSLSDNTPTFTWTPSLYEGEIEGYTVKIDDNSEIYVGDGTSWTTSSNLSNGIHTFYVKAIAEDGTKSNYATTTFNIDTSTIDSDGDGWTDEEEQKYETDPYDPNNYPLDTDGDGIPDDFDDDSDGDGYSDEMENSYNTNPKNPGDYPLDTDGDGTPDEDSPDGKYIGDKEDDGDRLNDKIEKQIGSDPKNPNDVERIYIEGKSYFMVNISQNDKYDILYNPIKNQTTAVKKQNNIYLIDVDDDNSWDYKYNPSNQMTAEYKEEGLNIWMIATILLMGSTAAVTAIYIVFFRDKKTNKNIFKKTTDFEKTETYTHYDDISQLDTIDLTKNLLQDMQHTVGQYMEKLDAMQKEMYAEEKQKPKPSTDQPDETFPPSEKIKDITIEENISDSSIVIEDIESKIDKILTGVTKNKNYGQKGRDIEAKVDELITKQNFGK